MKTKDLSDNSLMELRGLVNRITTLIERDYCHVSELLPKSITKSLANVDKAIEKEIDIRENS